MNNVIWSHIFTLLLHKERKQYSQKQTWLGFKCRYKQPWPRIEFKSLAEQVSDCEPQGVKLLPPAPWTISKPLVLVGRKNLKINDEGEND